jgi:hypothetical protein
VSEGVGYTDTQSQMRKRNLLPRESKFGMWCSRCVCLKEFESEEVRLLVLDGVGRGSLGGVVAGRC